MCSNTAGRLDLFFFHYLKSNAFKCRTVVKLDFYNVSTSMFDKLNICGQSLCHTSSSVLLLLFNKQFQKLSVAAHEWFD